MTKLCNLRIDVALGGISGRVASNINLIHRLIHSHVIHAEMVRKGEVFKIHGTKVLGHAKIHNHVLCVVNIPE
jgi:hypothetical protein